LSQAEAAVVKARAAIPISGIRAKFMATPSPSKAKGDVDRRLHVLAGVEAGRQHLDQHVGGQARDDDREDERRRRRVLRGELAALEERRHDRSGSHRKRHGGGEGKQHRQFGRLALHVCARS
jgi:hypothetical protein